MVKLSVCLSVIFVIVIATGTRVDGENDIYKEIGRLETKHPAFLRIGEWGGRLSMIISQFSGNPASSGKIKIVEDLTGSIGDWPQAKVSPLVSSGLRWPNEVRILEPGSLPNVGEAFLIGDGFLVPGKNKGGIHLFEAGTKGPTALSSIEKGWFYHRAYPMDVNGDGRLDIITARGKKPVKGKGSGELIWLEQPADNVRQQWTMHKLVDGPDVHFAILPGPSDTIFIFASEFFGEKLSVTHLALGSAKVLSYDVIDDTIGPLFDVSIEDLYNDGTLELLVTNHIDKEDQSGVWAYEIPDDPTATGSFIKHTLATGFKTIVGGIGAASPGVAIPAPAKVGDTSSPQYILLSGDGTTEAYILIPNPDKLFDYTVEVIIPATDGTIGQVAVADVDGDGFNNFFIPDYDNGIIYAYTFV